MTLRVTLLMLVLLPAVATAGSKIIGTGGATTIEGNAGGGIVPWAVINGYASSEEWSVTTFASRVGVNNFNLSSGGIALSFDNRWELSYARQRFALESIGGNLAQDIFSVKYHLAGELLYTAMPQLSFGISHKRNADFALPEAVGAKSANGTDFYLAASKVLFHQLAGRNLLLNGTIRATKANQTGLLGFGSAIDNDYQFLFEGSAALLLNYNLALGIEFKQKPDNLAFAAEQHWRDIFIAWFINKNVSLTGAYVDLGHIAGQGSQTGYYLALEATW
ncbi:DUF3034 family protein [Arsukibacterium sp.]|uniref:DUF3034 family protein n=1 Tax=Arsukibacterium sp. TaxID=1977258 RepID=UPI00299D806A|nr:DUF3034 family protein [Arsukibacterium sp.]MDX1678675.1 DUF3034 family protein [Arsukibacterium sp.]